VPSAKLSACLVSPHPLVLERLTRLLSTCGVSVEAERLDFSMAPRMRLSSADRSALYVIDACLPRPATEGLVRDILGETPSARIIIVAETFDEESAFPLLRLGVKGLLPYAEAPQQLSRAVSTVASGGLWAPRRLLSRFVETVLSNGRGRKMAANGHGLSRREHDVLQALVENLSNKEIAGRLHISERTVKFHVSNLLSKFGVQRRADLIVRSFPGAAPVH
jgi:DNA-binding NarL/FixJ family response regulator